MAQQVQTVIFSKANWTDGDARVWLREHDMRAPKPDETEDSLRYRQFDPNQCAPDSFSTLTENMPAGVSMVSCDRTGGESSRPRDLERRAFQGGIELRETEGEPRQLVGHAAVFDRPADDMFMFGLKFPVMREFVARGAFAESIGKDDVRALWNHDPNFVLGRTRAGTLQLMEDEVGLGVEISPPDSTWARDLMLTIGRGDVSQMSFGFRVLDEEWSEEAENGAGVVVRTLKRVQLFDVSPVTFPAYPDTDIAVRGMTKWLSERCEGMLALRYARIRRLRLDICT